MKLISVLLPGLLAFGFTAMGLAAGAQAAPIEIAVPDPKGSATPSASLPPLDLQLNPTQQAAVAEIADFAFDQFDAILSSGLDPAKLDRAEMKRRATKIGDRLRTVRPDAAQLEQLRAILRSAREQMERRIETELPAK